MAAFFGEQGHALLLDCRDLSVEQVPLELGGWTLGVADSGSRHTHAESGYNERRRGVRARPAAALGVESLRDADEPGARALPEPLDRRVRHVLRENERVRRGVEALRGGDMPTLAALLDASHASLRDDYEVSVPEVEQHRDAHEAKPARPGHASWAAASEARCSRSSRPAGVPPTTCSSVAPAAGARLL